MSLKNIMRYSNLKVWPQLYETKWVVYPFMNKVECNFIIILWNFYFKLIHLWNESMSIYRIFGDVLGTIIIIL